MRKLRIEFGHKMVEKKELLEVCLLVGGRVCKETAVNWAAELYICTLFSIISYVLVEF